MKTIESMGNSIGDDVDLLVDAHNAYNPHTESRIALVFEAFGVFHFEEPIAAHDWDGMAWIRGQTMTPIAAGEQIYTLTEFRRFLILGAVDILQLDITKVGGVLAAKKIDALAESRAVPLTLHNYHSPVATAAMLHFAASTPDCRYRQEVCAEPHPLENIVLNPLLTESGSMCPPGEPGLGLFL